MEVPEFPGYLIHEDGRVVKVLTNKELKHSQEKGGAYFVNIVKPNGMKSPIRVSRLVALAYVAKDDPEKTYVGFIDKNPSNHSVSNLRWGRKHDHLSAIATRELTETRECKVCKQTKALDGFPKAGKGKRTGKAHYRRECWTCRADRDRNKRHADTEYAEQVRQRGRAWRLRSDYGLTPEAKTQIYREQNECCKICDKRFEKESDAHVDHKHDETGRVRGLLCPNCNRMLGMAKDNPDILRRGAMYLESSESPTPS